MLKKLIWHLSASILKKKKRERKVNVALLNLIILSAWFLKFSLKYEDFF